MTTCANDSSAYDLEYRYDADDAWYSVKVVVAEAADTLKVKYKDFDDSSDVTFRAEQFTTVSDVDDLIARFRPLSRQLQDFECDKAVEGITVCASYTFGASDLRFYDAIVEAVHREKHSFANGEEECRCCFVLFWQHGLNAGNLTYTGIASICLVEQAAQVDPRILRFSILAKKTIASTLAKSTKISVSKRCAPVLMGQLCHEENSMSSAKQKSVSSESGFQVMEASSKFCGIICENLHDGDVRGDSICMNGFVETGIYHFLLIENLEKDLSPLTIREFIYKETSISSQVYIFPSRSSQPYARGAIVLQCRKELEKICDLLNNPNQLIVSARGRPWVITERALRSGTFKTMLQSSIHSSQDKTKDIEKELKVVHLGTEAYKKAKDVMDLFMELAQHEQRLHKRFAYEQMRILELTGSV